MMELMEVEMELPGMMAADGGNGDDGARAGMMELTGM